MFASKLVALTGIAVVSAAFSLSALAHTHRGTPLQSSIADREVTLADGAKYLNVQRNETVKINVAGKSFIWRFDTIGTAPFKLGDIAPQGMGGNIVVYVANDPAEISGGD